MDLLPLPDLKNSGCCSRRDPFVFRCTFYASLRGCEKIRLLFSSRPMRLSMHLLPLPYGRGSVSSINYIRSRDREGAVKGAGNASAFERGKKAIRYFFASPHGRGSEKFRLLFSSRSIRFSMHLLPLPHGRGSVSSINHMRSRDREGAVKGAWGATKRIPVGTGISGRLAECPGGRRSVFLPRCERGAHLLSRGGLPWGW